jgi:hypothetical protein
MKFFAYVLFFRHDFTRNGGWHFSPACRTNKDDDVWETTCEKDHVETPPLLPHLACDAVAMRQWASVAVAELNVLKLAERHLTLQITAMANDNQRLERQLGASKHAEMQVKKTCKLNLTA